jgi:hypothetical protein
MKKWAQQLSTENAFDILQNIFLFFYLKLVFYDKINISKFFKVVSSF